MLLAGRVTDTVLNLPAIQLRGVFYGLEPEGSSIPDKQKFEYVILCKFDDDYELETVLELDWDTFLKNKHWHKRMTAWNLSLTRKLREQCKVIYERSDGQNK